jgi:hypothetical protein
MPDTGLWRHCLAGLGRVRRVVLLLERKLAAARTRIRDLEAANVRLRVECSTWKWRATLAEAHEADLRRDLGLPQAEAASRDLGRDRTALRQLKRRRSC